MIGAGERHTPEMPSTSVSTAGNKRKTATPYFLNYINTETRDNSKVRDMTEEELARGPRSEPLRECLLGRHEAHRAPDEGTATGATHRFVLQTRAAMPSGDWDN